MLRFSDPLFHTLQGLLPFEIERVSEGLEEGGNTETAMDDFQEGSLDSSAKSAEYSQQRDIYTQNKPRKKKKATDRELGRPPLSGINNWGLFPPPPPPPVLLYTSTLF